MNIFSLLYSSVLSNYLNLYRVFFDVQASHPVTNNIKNKNGVSLVAQSLRICLPMQGTRVRTLVWEDPTCRGATRPVSHNY